MARVRVGVLFGGRSGEHQVSLMSAASLLQALDPAKYEAVPIGITQEGRWLVGADPRQALTEGALSGRPAVLAPAPQPGGLMEYGGQAGALANPNDLTALDVVFPLLHGTFGEDGTVQGLLELAGLPYVGAGVAASAAGMDKALMKGLFKAAGLPQVPYIVTSRSRVETETNRIRGQVESDLGYPCFVKPANLGSSVGISKVKSPAALEDALRKAATYDVKLVVEAAAEDCREIEVGVFGNARPVASVPGEIVPSGEFYDYRAKYVDGTSELIIPAPLEEQTVADVRRLAVEAYTSIDCAGLARVDFFVHRRSGDVWVNEINTMPGFTEYSMYPKLWAHEGLRYGELIDRLIQLAFERFEERRRSQTRFSDD